MSPTKERTMFDITVRMRRNLKSRMGLCFTKGQVIRVRYSPEEMLNGHKVLSEGWSAIHPLFEGGTNPNVTVFIPLAWAERIA
jgi:hypothetical protein